MNERHPMPCLDAQALASFAEGRCADGERDALAAHLADCDDCREALRDLVAVTANGPGSVPAPAALTERILGALPPAPARKPEGSSMSRLRHPACAAAAALLVGLGLLSLFHGKRPRAPAGVSPAGEIPLSEVQVPARGPDLGGAERHLAHLATDKPLYRPGERVYGRAVVLAAFRRTPYAGSEGAGTIEVTSARGEVVHRGAARVVDGIAPFGWSVPGDVAGGTYRLTARFPWLGVPAAELEIGVRRYRAPRLVTDLQFLRNAYGPGEEVVATLEVRRAEGGVPAGAGVVAVARVDGEEIMRDETLELDAQGRCTIAFELLDEMEAGIGTLALVVSDGGVRETAARTIPIVLADIALSFLPEGGDLVAGVPGRVYFEARSPRGEPADVAGRIEGPGGAVVARFETVHEGRGAFNYTPAANATYRAVLERPHEQAFDLPPARAVGFSLRASRFAYGADEPIEVVLASPSSTKATVGLFVRERELALRAVQLEGGREAGVKLTPGDATGVLRVTVFDAAGTPRAERLVFRRPAAALDVELSVDAPSTVPGGTVTVNVRTSDAHGRPVPAVIGVVATDDAVLSKIDPRERAARLPVQALLGAEVRELADAQRYLDGEGREIDLLLATQGWRRFAVFQPERFFEVHGDAGRRALAFRSPRPLITRGLLAEERLGDADGLPGAPMPPALAKAEEHDGGDAAAEDAPPEPEPIPDPEMEFGARVAELRLEAGNYVPPVASWMRVYAHRVDANRPAAMRNDFTETVYWNAALKTDDDGRASFTFDAADSITTVRLRADALTMDGALAAGDATVEVRRPFYVEPKFPLEVSAGDRIELPVVVYGGRGDRAAATLRVDTGEGIRVVAGAEAALDVPANGSVRHVAELAVGELRGPVMLRIRASAGTDVDGVTRTIEVVPAGFPIEQGLGGILETVAEHEIVVPERILPGSMRTETAVYPTPLASLQEALEALLREPHGCFEQTSSTNYPNVMALQYMTSHEGVDPDVVRRARDLLAKGYAKLTAFECEAHGYEWFGRGAGHEALTAYGVLEFHDMSKVMAVDDAMMARTRSWLLGRRDGDGGFSRSDRALDSFGRAPDDITNAYILWALLEAGQQGLDKEIAALKARAQNTKDSYLLALGANVLSLSGDEPGALALMGRVAANQDASGRVTGAATSITRSGGDSLEVETTSLAVLAWLRAPEHTKNVEAAMRWLAERCQGGRFGSTQATVLALKAITAYDAARARPNAAGIITLRLDGQPLEAVSFPAGQQGPIRIPDLGPRLGPGKHTLELEMQGGGAMPYSITLRYAALTPASGRSAPVRIETTLAASEVKEGETVEARVTVRNATSEGQPMAVAIVGLPGGLEARAEQLEELVEAGTVDAVETRGREVILYWRSLAPEARHVVTIDCVAAVPGRYEGPASRAYLYYTDEQKHWVDGMSIRIR
jgi:hypothetical protein